MSSSFWQLAVGLRDLSHDEKEVFAYFDLKWP